ncbi:MAG: hypothetical protein IJ574_02840 [Bacilli bacterium]|nr:hypothetical protein [Bacilli bacterium]
MKNTKIFNEYEFHKAVNTSRNNLNKAIIMLEEYIEKYPDDYCAYDYYALFLIRNGIYDKAQNIINVTKSKIDKDIQFQREVEKYKKSSYRYIHNKLLILAAKEKYQEFYDYYIENIKIIKEMYEALDVNLESLFFYSKIQLGIKPKHNRDYYSYLYRQIIEYNEEEFLEHVKKHMADYNYENDYYSNSLFAENFDYNKILKEVKKNIPSNNRKIDEFITDYYYFKYDNCGRYDYKIQDYFKVIVLHNTANIITMYPTTLSEDIPYIDLNYLKALEEQPKTKRLSQVDKFKTKYNLK